VLRPYLDERQWRLLLGAEAVAIGRGGIALVARLSGASRSTVQVGVNEVRAGAELDGRVRAPGAGRPAREDAQPGITEALEELVDPETRGDPSSVLRWTTKSAAQLVKSLTAKGFTVGKTTVTRLLKKAGYRPQSTFKTKEGASHPDRDAQFRHINETAAESLAAGDPVISVDTKKKEPAPRKRPAISLAQLGGIRRNIPGSNGLLEAERRLGDNSMPEKQWPRPGTRSGVLRDPSDTVKA
jgi:hypothetical protein